MKLKDRIYQTQCFDNIEPIEYMVPYPNLRSLITGQNIKYADHAVFKDENLTNRNVLNLVNQTANWLESVGVKPEHRVLIYGFEFPYAEIIAFGIWSIGASLVITDDKVTSAIEGINPDFALDGNEILLPGSICDFPAEYNHCVNRLLPDEALIFWSNGKGIRLSHYNLLVNANGFYRISGLDEKKSFRVNLPPTSTAWAVFQAVLPFYSGAVLTGESPDVTIGFSGQFGRTDYELIEKQPKSSSEKVIPIQICPENTAVLTIGNDPNHMTEIQRESNNLFVKGHSVMMGYTDDELNEKTFTEKGLVLPGQ